MKPYPALTTPVPKMNRFPNSFNERSGNLCSVRGTITQATEHPNWAAYGSKVVLWPTAQQLGQYRRSPDRDLRAADTRPGASLLPERSSSFCFSHLYTHSCAHA